MKKNRRVKKSMSMNASIVTHASVIVLVCFVMVILNLLASSSCQHLAKEIGEKEKTLAKLDDAYNREEMRWEELKTPERLDEALRNHGLAMKPPRPNQNVHMSADGQPYCGQLAVTQARRRNAGMAAQVGRIRR